MKMASSGGSGTSSGSSGIQNSGSDEGLQNLMDQRKRKRMISNRESARRSRMRKQKHLDDLTAQVGQLRKENSQIIASINLTAQQYLNVEAENSVLRAQVAELNHRLQALNEIIEFLNANGGVDLGIDEPYCSFGGGEPGDGFLMANAWNHPYVNRHHLQPLVMAASADMMHY